MSVLDQASARKLAAACDGWRKRPELRIERDGMGRPVRAYIGALDITHLVVRVQANTTMHGTHIEVVLSQDAPHAPGGPA